MLTNKILKCCIACVIIFTLFFPGLSPVHATQAAVNVKGPEIWSARYNGPDSKDDKVYGMVVDSTGNVYITGSAGGKGLNHSKIITIKYGPKGALLWSRYYDVGPGTTEGAYWDESRVIAMDPSGNIYVVGFSAAAPGFDIVMLKYTPAGTLAWERRYAGPDTLDLNYNNGAYAVTVDENFVYIAGEAKSQMIILKYKLNGDRVWERLYSYGTARAIKVDSAGNVYITGDTYRDGSDVDFITIKYSPDGTRNWVKYYTGPGSEEDRPVDLVVDDNGNVCVTGKSDRVEQSIVYSDVATVKYASNGTQLWAQRYSKTQYGSIFVKAIAADSAGNVYIAGTAIIKYYTNGNIAWEKDYGNPSFKFSSASDMVLDSSANIYVTGKDNIIKLDADGHTLWVVNSGTTLNDSLITVDQVRNIYTTGNTVTDTQVRIDILTVKYPPQPGSFMFIDDVALPEGNIPGDNSEARFIVRLSEVVDYDITLNYATGDGSAVAGTDYTAASGSLTIPHGADSGVITVPILEDVSPGEGDKTFSLNLLVVENAMLSKPQGFATILEDDLDLQKWLVQYSGQSGVTRNAPSDMEMDEAGNIYLAVTAPKPDNIYLSVSSVLKYDPNGNTVFEKNLTGVVYDLSLDHLGNIFIAGVDNDNNGMLIKYLSNGSLAWERTYSGAFDNIDAIRSIYTAADGYIYVTGETVTAVWGSDSLTDFITLKYDQDGNMLWSQQYSDPAHGYNWTTKIDGDASGNVYVAGSCSNNSGGVSITIVKYGSDGNFIWAQQFYYYEEGAAGKNLVHDMTVDSEGNIYIGGQAYRKNNYNGTNGLIIKFSPSGDLVWWIPMGYMYSSEESLVVDGKGNVFITGYTDSVRVTQMYTRNGVWGWQSTLGGGSYITLDKVGNIFIVGNNDVMMFDPAGRRLWEQAFITTPQSSFNRTLKCVVDQGGNIYVTGNAENTTTTLVKYTAFPFPPYIRTTDGNIKETDSGTTDLIVTVNLSTPSDSAVSMSYTTVDGTALDGIDYQSVSGTLTIPAQSLSGTITIPVIGDISKEPRRFFFVNLSDLSPNASFSRSQATATIWDNDAILIFLPLVAH